ncbi:MAG: hypothetical protein ACTSPD_09855 [Promethearchaeota archaeon]
MYESTLDVENDDYRTGERERSENSVGNYFIPETLTVYGKSIK